MAFRFTLAAALRLRKSLEHREWLKLETLLGEQARIEQALQASRGRLVELKRQLTEQLQRGSVPALEIHCHLGCVARAQAFAGDLARRLQAAQAAVQQQRERYQQERRKREALESLRDKQLQEYTRLEQRREQAALDAIYAARSAAGK